MVNLDKTTDENDDVNERFPWGLDNEAWNSTVLLPMYLGTVYPHGKALSIYQALKSNMYEGLQVLLHFEHSYDNQTGELR